MILVHTLLVAWDKSSRGALEGAKRRAVRETASFPCPVLPEADEVWCHSYAAGNEGEVRSSGAERLEPASLYSFRIFYNSAVEVRPGLEECHVLRKESSVPILRLLRGQTGRVRIQGVTCCNEGTAWYEKYVFNVAWLDRYDSEVFRLRPFTHIHDDLPDLRFAASTTR